MREFSCRPAGPELFIIQDCSTCKVVATLHKVEGEQWEGRGEVDGKWQTVLTGEFEETKHTLLDTVYKTYPWILYKG